MNASVHSKGRKSGSTWNIELSSQYRYTSAVRKQFFRITHRRLSTNVDMPKCELRATRSTCGKDRAGFGIGSLSRSFRRAFFPPLFSSSSTAPLTARVRKRISCGRSADTCEISRARTQEESSVESVSARLQCRSDLFPFSFFLRTRQDYMTRYVSQFLRNVSVTRRNFNFAT